jgi:hypothetical protein
MDGPVVEITLMPTNHLDRETVARLADLMPLRFRLPRANVAKILADAADINLRHLEGWEKG